MLFPPQSIPAFAGEMGKGNWVETWPCHLAYRGMEMTCQEVLRWPAHSTQVGHHYPFVDRRSVRSSVAAAREMTVALVFRLDLWRCDDSLL
jgi:hypothetical protein